MRSRLAPESILLCLAEVPDVHQATSMLEDILAEVVNSSDVALAMAELLEEETPTWAELRRGTPLAQAAIPQPCGKPTDTNHSSSSSGEHDNADESVVSDLAPGSSGDSGRNAQHADDAEEGAHDTGDVHRVIQHAEYQSFAEYVLESACFSLLQESAAGRWQDPNSH